MNTIAVERSTQNVSVGIGNAAYWKSVNLWLILTDWKQL
jgi:hypothetical protein